MIRNKKWNTEFHVLFKTLLHCTNFMLKKCGFPHKIPNLNLPFFIAFLNCAQYITDRRPNKQYFY